MFDGSETEKPEKPIDVKKFFLQRVDETSSLQLAKRSVNYINAKVQQVRKPFRKSLENVTKTQIGMRQVEVKTVVCMVSVKVKYFVNQLESKELESKFLQKFNVPL